MGRVVVLYRKQMFVVTDVYMHVGVLSPCMPVIHIAAIIHSKLPFLNRLVAINYMSNIRSEISLKYNLLLTLFFAFF